MGLRKILVFGNSGAGKSTLAKKLSADENIAHLDLDVLAFKMESPTESRNIEESLEEVKTFLEEYDSWVIEGGYADIFEPILNYANEMVYLDLPAPSCRQNAVNREWEPHKYESKDAQDKNLDMLLNWIQAYYFRNDAFSKASHDRLFDQYSDRKKRITENR